MNTLEVLKKARALLADPKNWCQHAFAKDSDHNELDSGREAGAVQFCSIGALQKVAGETPELGYAISALETRVGQVSTTHSIAGYNDEHSYETVMAMWDDVIFIEEERQAVREEMLVKYWEPLPGENEEEREIEEPSSEHWEYLMKEGREVELA